ncbi:MULTISPECIES: VCBS domain-containing protein [Vibrio]|uniref:VCBS domain-containing protein n=1 Tax=Vibrio bivalvicida TaxID=1276888 RepID=A0ABV4MCB0_9VIBR|nr:VCBS domain-containing protein [Vibrio sp. VPAP30]KLN64857.1 adhesin [Vibrio sp. VPAP30]
MDYLHQMTNDDHTVNSFVAQSDFFPLLFDSGKLQISGENRRCVRFNPKSVVAKTGTLGSLVISESGYWDYSVYSIKTQYLAIGERKLETFSLRSKEGKRFTVNIVLIGAIGGAWIEELETNFRFG